VLKHAPGADVTVALDYRPDGLHLSVTDTGTSAPALPVSPADATDGQGLIGMRERVMLFAGELSTGPRPGGGFAVHARLPVPAEVHR
jgi:signal transduction histidine kinase